MNLLYPDNVSEDEGSFVKDENTINALKMLNIKSLLAAEEADVMRYLTADGAVIEYRQKLFRDIDRNPAVYDVLKSLSKQMGDINDVMRKRSIFGHVSEDVLYSFSAVSMYTDMIKFAAESTAEIINSLESEGLRELFSGMAEMAKSDKFREVTVLVAKINDSIHHAHSLTLGLNLNAKFEAYEAGIVSINSEPFTSSDIFSKIFGKIGKKDGGESMECFMPLVENAVGESSGFAQAVYRALNGYILRSAVKARTTLMGYIQTTVSPIYLIGEELEFVMTCCDFIRELREKKCVCCMPEVSDGAFVIRKMANPHLLKKMPYHAVTKNDADFAPDVSISVITGPNSGGKSVYLRSVGVAYVMYQLGMFVPAEYAKLPTVSAIYCHFAIEDTISESRFVDECRRMREILNIIGDTSLLLMDESFSGTNSTEGAAIAVEVLKSVQASKTRCFFSTHLHEVALQAGRFNEKSPRVNTLSAEYTDGKRTYKIIEQEPEGMSFAYEIAKEYGLEYNGK